MSDKTATTVYVATVADGDDPNSPSDSIIGVFSSADAALAVAKKLGPLTAQVAAYEIDAVPEWADD